MNIQEAYKLLQSQCGIEAGDEVKILRNFEDCECGFQYISNDRINEFIGNIYKVRSPTPIAIEINISGAVYRFPFFVLQIVKRAQKGTKIGPYEIKFKENGDIIAGCQIVSFDELENVYKLAKNNFDNKKVSQLGLPYECSIIEVPTGAIFEHFNSKYKKINNNPIKILHLANNDQVNFYYLDMKVKVISHS